MLLSLPRPSGSIVPVQSWPLGTSSARTVPELEDAFEARLMNLAATHKLLSENNWHSAAISGLVRSAVQPYCPPNYDDCQFSGKEVRLPASMVLTLTMILHELATNAAKHGAFENDIRRERQMDGIKKARERGIRFGRKPLLISETIQKVRKLRKAGKTVPEIMRQTSCRRRRCTAPCRHKPMSA